MADKVVFIDQQADTQDRCRRNWQRLAKELAKGFGGGFKAIELPVTDSIIVDEPFTYANGQVDTVTGGVWVEKNQFLPWSGSSSTDVTIASNKLSCGTTDRNVRYTPAVSLPTNYDIKVDFAMSSASGTGEFGIVFRHNGTSTGLMLFVKKSAGAFELKFKNAGFGDESSAFAGPTIVSAQVYTFQIEVRGNSIRALVDNAEIIPAQTITTGAGNNGVGLTFGTTSSNTSTFDNYRIQTPGGLSMIQGTPAVTIDGGQCYRVRCYFQKSLAGDDWGVRVGTNDANWYGFRWTAAGVAKLEKSVAGVLTDLGTTVSYTSNANVHAIEFFISVDATNWMGFVLNRPDGTTSSALATDASINLDGAEISTWVYSDSNESTRNLGYVAGDGP